MCTLTYIPIGDEDFYFTTNRDESPLREALFPNLYLINKKKVLFPKDKMAEGTWMMCHEKGFSACLLNGGYEKHEHKPPYRKSRGIMVLELGNYSSVKEFISDFNFTGMEPFTFLVVSYLTTRKLEELRWDGETIHYRKLDTSRSYIWSSSTLYNKDARLMRQKWFDDWREKTSVFSKNAIFNFHTTTGREDPMNGIVMNRKEKVKTLSVTQIRKEGSKLQMFYYDFGKNELKDYMFK